MTISAGMPSSLAASATPWAWLPDEKATTPRCALVGRELDQAVVGAAELEGAHPLQGLGLDQHPQAQALVQRRALDQRRARRRWPARRAAAASMSAKAGRSFREHHGVVGEGLELQRVAGGVEEEHRRLLAGLALEADLRLDDELRSRPPSACAASALPLRQGQDRPEVAHRHVVAVDRIGRLVPDLVRRQVGHDLVAVEVEVDPFVAGAPLGAAEQRRRRRRAPRRGRGRGRPGGSGAGSCMRL